MPRGLMRLLLFGCIFLFSFYLFTRMPYWVEDFPSKNNSGGNLGESGSDEDEQNVDEDINEGGSSRLCFGESPLMRSCRFTNVCLKDEKLLYFSKPPLELSDPFLVLGTYEAHPKLSLIIKPLEDLAKLKKPVVIPTSLSMLSPSPSSGLKSSIEWIKIPTFFHASPSQMYYHWLLDDTLGLFWLMRKFKRLERENRVVIFGEYSNKLTLHLQGVFTDNSIIKASESQDKMLCFDEVYAGPAMHHFGGPGKDSVTALDLLEMRDYFFESFHNMGALPEKATITLLKRTSSRLILNREELSERLKQIPSVLFQEVLLEELSLKEQLELLGKTSILIGMHGSGLSNTLFLPAGTSLIELFPYQFKRNSYQLLAEAANVFYSSWQNLDKTKTKFHPEILDTFKELTHEEKEKIIENPIFTTSWAANLYWVNQDTEIDIDGVVFLVQKSLAKGLNKQLANF